MRRLQRGAARAKDRTPPGSYEIQFRLESSYRGWGIPFFLVGSIGFLLAIVSGHFLLFLLSGPAFGGGIWLYLNDPREYYLLQPRRYRLLVVRAYGKKRKIRGEYDVREFVRLETARYVDRKRGERCLVVLFRGNGSAEKIDDRPDKPELDEVCGQVAEAAGLEFVARGRVDEPPRRGAKPGEQQTVDA